MIPHEVQEAGFDWDWDNNKLWGLQLPTKTISAEELEYHLDVPFWGKREGTYGIRPREVLANPRRYPVHAARIQAADTSYPIHVMKKGGRYVILDGLHRFAKLQSSGTATVRAVVVPPSWKKHIQVKEASTNDWLWKGFVTEMEKQALSPALLARARNTALGKAHQNRAARIILHSLLRRGRLTAEETGNLGRRLVAQEARRELQAHLFNNALIGKRDPLHPPASPLSMPYRNYIPDHLRERIEPHINVGPLLRYVSSNRRGPPGVFHRAVQNSQTSPEALGSMLLRGEI